MLRTRHRRFILFLGDITTLWAGLIAVLALRYDSETFGELFLLHTIPFGIVFATYILTLYIAGSYDIRATRTTRDLITIIAIAAMISGFIAVLLFYFIPIFGITPRANLVFVFGMATILLTGWRLVFHSSARISSKSRVLLVGTSEEVEELAAAIRSYPQHGYVIIGHYKNPTEALAHINDEHSDIVVSTREAQADSTFVQAIYESLPHGTRFIDAALFYERLLGKIPVQMISRAWFLENIAETEKNMFEHTKRGVDVLCALVLSIITIPLAPIVALLIKLDSRGPVLLRQQRVGKMGSTYTHYKYRTMRALSPEGHAELNGVEWTSKNDARVTRVGKLLRATRVDELPQLWNVLKGDLSFVGPRPERPEFVAELRKHIPYYDMRHLVRPGLSGWAQVSPPYYYGTEKEAMLKLQYDLYYIKNRDLGLDLDISLRTLMVILSARGR